MKGPPNKQANPAADQVAPDRTITSAEPLAGPATAAERGEARYRVESELARGGLGRILKAHDTHLDRTVAVKELLAATSLSRERFSREVAITAKLQHPAIVPVYDAGRWLDDEPYYVMKLLSDGRTLKQVVDETPDPEARRALLPHVIAVVDAIAYAHSLGIIHRDIKPSNVLVGPFGETVIIDWGLAKDLAQPHEAPELDVGPYRTAPAEATAIGSVVGTPQYMPPEQARGEIVDKASDVYALGALLYHVLTGQPPYPAGDATEVLARVRDEAPVPLVQRQKGLPQDLVAVVEQAMARLPSARYQDARQLADDLKRFQAGQLVRAHRYSTLSIVARWAARHRLPVLLSAAFVLALLALGTVSVRHIVRGRRLAEARRDELVLAQANSQLRIDPLTAITWLRQYPPGAADWDEAHALATEAEYLRLPDRQLQPDEPPVDAVAVSADLNRYAAVGIDQRLRIGRTDDGTILADEPRREHPWTLDFAPGGDLVAVGGIMGSLEVWGLGHRHQALAGHDGPIRAARFVDDQTLLSAGGRKVFAWRLQHGGVTRVAAADADDTIAFADVAADGTLAYVSAAHTLYLWHAPDGAARHWPLPAALATPTALAIAPDGRTVAIGDTAGQVETLDAATGRFSPRARHQRPVTRLAFSPDGRQLASAGSDLVIRITRGDGTTRELRGHAGPVLALAFSRDGARLASAGTDEPVRVWQLDSGEATLLRGHRGRVDVLRFAPDGRRLFAGGSGRTLRVWSLDAREAGVLRGHGDNVFHVRYTTDGAHLISESMDRTLRVWDVTNGSARVLALHKDTPYGFAYDANHELIASAGWDGLVGVWHSDDEKPLAALRHGGLVHSVAFSRSGARLVTSSADGRVRVYSTTDFTLQQELIGHHGPVLWAAISGDEQEVVSGGEDGTVRLWRLADGSSRVLSDAGHKEVYFVDFSADDRHVISVGDDRNVRVWERASGNTRILSGPQDVILRPQLVDADHVLAASWDGRVWVWDLRSGAATSYGGHRARIRYFDVSADHRYMATASDDHTVRLWDVRTGDSMIVGSHDDSARGVAFAPNGDIASAGEDQVVRLWHVDLRRMVPRAPAALRSWLAGHQQLSLARGRERAF